MNRCMQLRLRAMPAILDHYAVSPLSGNGIVYSLYSYSRITQMAELDLNLLHVLVALDDKRSVSGAALKLQQEASPR